ncbi:ClC family H(+)/Cl(-) exchange transporter [Streptomyces globosus]|uniref:ClC family H(+)/Cl(-) exchange transporter n=1 Tax=Streptomyces globosus TaxID=68209 RepID=A0A344U1Q5_9ACTN|nr:chloride channel protein [Streptomyces globosus]AXE24826.1 ClC family H(+)/Cl(-) exchange transporter [Streptomyces globosus]
MTARRLRGACRAHLVAALAGCLVGLVGGAFRWCLQRADALRGRLLETAAGLGGGLGWLVPVALTAAGAALACAIARRVPHAAGSGIQHVEAVWRGESEAPTWRLLPAKFAGGVVAIGSGLVLGREGPAVHMGAAIGAEAGRRTGLGADDIRLLHTSLAGAGLAVAFAAPLGGLLFVCEEVTRSVRPRLVLMTLVGTAAAAAVSALIAGGAPIFPFPDAPAPPVWLLPVFLLFGATAGLLGAAYGGLVIGSLALSDRLAARVPATARAALIGAVVGLLMAVDPLFAGGGDPLGERLLAGWSPAVGVLAAYLAVRFAAGPLSYAAGTPGGLFAPLLAVGALWGALAHAAAGPLLPGQAAGSGAFAVVGMAALFAAVVRAPATGIVLVVEMTGATSLVLPLLAACFAAALTADRLGSEPVYDRLRRRMQERP